MNLASPRQSKIRIMLLMLVLFMGDCCADVATTAVMGLGLAGPLLGGGSTSPVAGYVPGQTPVNLQNLYFHVDYGANNDTPIIVHLVIVYDPLLIATFINMNSQDYFKNADQIYNDHMQTLDVMRWNGLPGGSQKGPFPVQYTKPNPLAAFLFARYVNASNTKTRLGSGKDISVILQSNSFVVTPHPGDD